MPTAELVMEPGVDSTEYADSFTGRTSNQETHPPFPSRAGTPEAGLAPPIGWAAPKPARSDVAQIQPPRPYNQGQSEECFCV